MKDLNSETSELNDAELDAVTGGTVVDTVVAAVTKIWNVITAPAKGVDGEANHQDHKNWDL